MESAEGSRCISGQSKEICESEADLKTKYATNQSFQNIASAESHIKNKSLALPFEEINLYDQKFLLAEDLEIKHDSDRDSPRKPHFLDEDYVASSSTSKSSPTVPKTFDLKTSDHFKVNSLGQISANHSRANEYFQILNSCNNKHSSLNMEKKHHSLDRNPRRSRDYNSEEGDHIGNFVQRPGGSPCLDAVPGLSSLYHGTWPVERGPYWGHDCQTAPSVMSFDSTTPIKYSHISRRSLPTPKQLGSKVECVYSLLSMLGSSSSDEMSQKFLEMSNSVESCIAMRQSGCIPLLVQLVHSNPDQETRRKAGIALHNVVHSHPDDKAGRREAKVLRLLEQIRNYCDNIRKELLEEKSERDNSLEGAKEQDSHPTSVIGTLTKISFDEEHRHAMCQLGGIHAIVELVQLDHSIHGDNTMNQHCITIRRYAGMTLTNLTFGDGNNKALLCSFKEFLKALVAQLHSSNEELMQAASSVLRNMSWRADPTSKQILREVGAVLGLTHAAMKGKKESTLKSILSALWNLSAHCSLNKIDICSVEGALGFLVDMLNYKAPSKTLAIVENAGGILRNVSSHIAIREDYREVLRQHHCLSILLQQLKSPSLIIVSNACGTLWNLSARCQQDQQFLWDSGAIPMLKSLIHSKHKMISMGSSAALKNLMNAKLPGIGGLIMLDSTTRDLGLPVLPTLGARKQKALQQELDENLTETCENIEPIVSPSTREDKYNSTHSHHFHNGISSSNLERRLTNSSNIKTGNYLSQSCGNSMIQNKGYQSNLKLSYSMETRNKYTSDVFKIESDVNDPHLDYKYFETANVSDKNNVCTSSSGISKQTVQYGDYQETDLDQPTDYSLRYAENYSESTSDTEDLEQYGAQERTCVHEDTVKCYYTEGTPYNFSTRTSMTDLRQSSNPDDEKYATSKEQMRKKESSVKKLADKMSSSDEKDSCSDDNDAALEVMDKKETNDLKFSSGITSPEKPVNYCEEGTPGYFSRDNSLSSLEEGNLVKKENEIYSINTTDHIYTDIELYSGKGPDIVSQPTDAELSGKAVSAINFTQETPLMFSRNSSVASLSSIDHPDVPDDYNSVISDLSRLTSGVVSPSELPDSPTQTIPSSPGTKLNSHIILVENKLSSSYPHNIFRDKVTSLTEDNFAQFSTGASLNTVITEDEHKSIVVKPKEIVEETIQKYSQLISGEQKENEIISRERFNDSMQIRCKQNISNKCDLKSNDDDDFQTYCTEDTPAFLSKAGSYSNLSVLSNVNDNVQEKNTQDGIKLGTKSFEENSDLCSNKRNSLAECIRSGMLESEEMQLQLEQENRETNNSLTCSDIQSNVTPTLSVFQFNKKSSNNTLLSNINMSAMDKTNKYEKQDCLTENLPTKSNDIREFLSYPAGGVVRDYLSTVNSAVTDEDASRFSNLTISAGTPKDTSKYETLHPVINCLYDEKREIPSINNLRSVAAGISSSSSSVESLAEGEQTLFEQCIKSGLPKGKTDDQKLRKIDPNLAEQICPYQETEQGIRYKRSQNEQIIDSFDLIEHNRRVNKSLPEVLPRQSYGLQKNLHVSHLPTYNNRFSKRSQQLENIAKFDKAKTEQQILEECINLGMPKRKPLINNQSDSWQLNTQINNKLPQNDLKCASKVINYHNQTLCQDDSRSKNVEVTSAAASVLQSVQNALVIDLATDVTNQEQIDGTIDDLEKITNVGQLINPLQQSNMPLIPQGISETSTASICKTQGKFPIYNTVTKSGFESQIVKFQGDNPNNLEDRPGQHLKEENILHIDESVMLNCSNANIPMHNSMEYLYNCELTPNTSNNSRQITDNQLFKKLDLGRLKDPDAMIASVDRLTAELVSQAKYLREKDEDSDISKKPEITEDTCSSDVSVLDITSSAPNVISIKSFIADTEQDDASLCISTTLNDADQSLKAENGIGDSIPYASATNTLTELQFMTKSSMIEFEASRLASAFENNTMAQSSCSMYLDQIKQPSQMGSLLSLTQSMSSNWDDEETTVNTEKTNIYLQNIKSRKKSLPVGLMVRRALGNYINTGSLENLEQSCISNTSSYNLDHMKPPSVMEDLLDMENSMTSVASITSEIGDYKDTSNNMPLFDSKHSQIPGFAMNSLTALENINPPSLMNELLILDTNLDSTREDTENSTVSDTPKYKRSRKTAKQNRKLITDRYKTYTIAAEMNITDNDLTTTNEDTEVYTPLEPSSMQSESTLTSNSRGKLTPKQRRQEDRSRFQTHILLNTPTDLIESLHLNPTDNNTAIIKPSCKQKRIDDKDRYKTHTLSSEHYEMKSTASSYDAQDELQAMLAHDANLVLGVLDQKQQRDDFLDLDCETISLISNDDDFDIGAIQSRKIELKKKCSSITANSCSAPIQESIKECSEPIKEKSHDEMNSLECDQYSETESCYQNSTENDCDKSEEHATKARIKVVKPEKVISNCEEIPKGIRGRRKALYVSPYKRATSGQVSKTNISKPKPVLSKSVDKTDVKLPPKSKSKISKPVTEVLTKKFVPKTTNISPNGDNSNILHKGKHTLMGTLSKSNSKLLTNTTVIDTKPTFERQGTFTKEEPSNTIPLSIPKTCSPIKTKIPLLGEKQNSSPSITPSRLPKNTGIPKSTSGPQSQLKSPSTLISRRKIPQPNTSSTDVGNSPTKTNSITTKSRIAMYNRAPVDRDRKVTTPKKGNITSSKSAESSNTPENVVTNKLASLWRKVEESKKQSNVKDTRVWITKDTDKGEATPASSGSKMQRSLTFEGTPTEKSEVAPVAKQNTSISIRSSQVRSKFGTRVPLYNKQIAFPNNVQRLSKLGSLA